jgi:hypothetical protein
MQPIVVPLPRLRAPCRTEAAAVAEVKMLRGAGNLSNDTRGRVAAGGLGLSSGGRACGWDCSHGAGEGGSPGEDGTADGVWRCGRRSLRRGARNVDNDHATGAGVLAGKAWRRSVPFP